MFPFNPYVFPVRGYESRNRTTYDAPPIRWEGALPVTEPCYRCGNPAPPASGTNGKAVCKACVRGGNRKRGRRTHGGRR